jgi:ethanolaminephosphotransferase
MVYVRQEKLPNLKQYNYSGVDHSLLSRYVLKPFYTHVVIKCFPLWMAPNLITLSGFSFVVVNLLTLLWYNPTLDQDCPPWVYATWAVGLFLYQTFDAVDGSQAQVNWGLFLESAETNLTLADDERIKADLSESSSTMASML